jgi:hypothetical protein
VQPNFAMRSIITLTMMITHGDNSLQGTPGRRSPPIKSVRNRGWCRRKADEFGERRRSLGFTLGMGLVLV